MSYEKLLRSIPPQGKIKVKGGQSQGYIQKTTQNISSSKLTPSVGKGAEYVAKYRAEAEKEYFENVALAYQNTARIDVTGKNSQSNLHQPEEMTSIGTLPNLQELDSENLTQVYQNYTFTQIEPPEHLESIFNEKDQILRLIENNQVCIIKGPTGCGKSTQIPQFILDSYYKRRAHCNIVVTQPRRIAAISISQRVCEERDWPIGGIVGYQVGLDKKSSEDTRLLYCTTGVLLEKLINCKHLNNYTHIILDEIHERDEDLDFTMLVVKKFLRSNSPNVKVVLMSATIDVSRFAKYFEVSLLDKKQVAPFYEIKRESKFSVQVHYSEALKDLGITVPEPKENEPTIHQEAYMLVPLMIRAFNRIDAEDYKSKRSHEKKGAVLIFLPGLHQIETLHEILMKEDEKSKKEARVHGNDTDQGVFNFWLCPLHSSITKDEQDKVRRLPPVGTRKVILSTNIAESSITIPDVKYVIDFCLTKHLVADPITGFSSLQLAWASHTNCIQREGRVGRVQDGRVYRLVTKRFYQFKMPKETVPEIRRSPLEILVLKCKRLMEDECPLKLISIALDPPDLDNYEKTILKLKEIGALLPTCRGEISPVDGDLTFMGRVMAGLPLDIRITKLILLGHAFDVLEEAIIMGCAMSVRNIFSEPFQRRLDAYNNKLLWADSSESDAIAYLNAYQVWRQLTGLGKFQRSKGSNEDAWGRRYMLQIKSLKEVALQEDDIKKRLKNFNIQVVRERNKSLWNIIEKPLILKIVLAGAFYPNYYSYSAQNPNAEMEAVKMLSQRDPNNSVYVQNMPHPAPIYFDQIKKFLQENGVSEDVKFHFDPSQKLVIEFNQHRYLSEKEDIGLGGKEMNKAIPGEIVMPVYRAIKLRQVYGSIPIQLYPPHIAREKLEAFALRSRSSLYSAHGMQSSDYKPAISLQQQHVELVICHIEDAGHFYAHIWPNNEKAQYIFEILNDGNALCKVSGDLVDNVIYAAPYKDNVDQPEYYYRAKIVRRYSFNEYVHVFFVDYGNSASVPTHTLREIVDEEIQKELDSIPPLAVECFLAQVEPSVWSDKGGQWSKDASTLVEKILVGGDRNSWDAKIYSYVNGVASVFVYLVENDSPSDRPPKTLNELLIERGFATKKEENYFSKLNHAEREEIEEKGEYNSGLYCTDETSSVSTSLLTQDLFSLPITHGPTKVHLKGPHSPLEMKVFSIMKSCLHKEVKVEWNSVNSVLLDSDPTDPHERFMVAGHVSQSSDGRRLTLNHTTVLPNMHGLAALLALIFAPTVELRTDDRRSRYTGALCGLGMDENGQPLFPENDIEVTFDVQFFDCDLITINKLRYWLNIRFCNDDSEDMPDSQIIYMHKHIKRYLMDLLKSVRQPMKVYHNPCKHLWGQVDKNYLRHPFPEMNASTWEKYIYQLHNGIDLNPINDRPYIEDLVIKQNKLHTALMSGVTPSNLDCVLCDLNFMYIGHLKGHMNSIYHTNLIQWLQSRAQIHGIHFIPFSNRNCLPDVEPLSSRPSKSRAN